MDPLPKAAVLRLLAQSLFQLRDGLIDEAVVQLDAFHRVLVAGARITVVEAQRRASRDGAKLGVIAREGVHDLLPAFARAQALGVGRAGRAGGWGAVEVGGESAVGLVLVQPLDLGFE